MIRTLSVFGQAECGHCSVDVMSLGRIRWGHKMCNDDPASTPMYFTIALHMNCADRHWYAFNYSENRFPLFAAFTSLLYKGKSPWNESLCRSR